MSTQPLTDKTIRPSSLMGYTYYHSSKEQGKEVAKSKVKHHRGIMLVLILIILLIASVIYSSLASSTSAPKAVKTTSHKTSALTTKPAKTVAPAATTPATTPCTGNALNELILVSISQRHLWACDQSSEVYNSAVVTGMSMYADTITPTGTYHIYAKEKDTYLKGSDETGSWDDFVNYWMPFLDNQYGAYGLHDATWRDPSAFGNISPDSADASHGCVELPLATAAWLYNWSVVGTTVTIEN